MRFLGGVLFVVLMSPLAPAQSHAHESQPQQPGAPKSVEKATPSDTQKSFDKLKTLAGSWEGHPKVVRTPGDHSGRSRSAPLMSTPQVATSVLSRSRSSAERSGHGPCSFGTQMVRPATRVCSPQREVSQVSVGVGVTSAPIRTRTVPPAPLAGFGHRRRLA